MIELHSETEIDDQPDTDEPTVKDFEALAARMRKGINSGHGAALDGDDCAIVLAALGIAIAATPSN